MRTSSSHEEGVKRNWSVSTKKFEGKDGKVTDLILEKVKWESDGNGQFSMKPVKAPLIKLKADLVLLAMGFVHPIHTGLLEEINISSSLKLISWLSFVYS